MGLKLVEGRFYEEADLAPGRRLFVVDQSFARKFFPNGLCRRWKVRIWRSAGKA